MKKLRNRKGLSITELLTAMLMLGLMTAVVATAVNLSSREYMRSVNAAGAQTLCSTLTMAVEDELRFAENISGSGEDYTYFSRSRGGGANSSIVIVDENGALQTGGNPKGYLAVRNLADQLKHFTGMSSYTNGLKASITSSWDAAERIFSVSLSIIDTEDRTLASSTFRVEPFADY